MALMDESPPPERHLLISGTTKYKTTYPLIYNLKSVFIFKSETKAFGTKNIDMVLSTLRHTGFSSVKCVFLLVTFFAVFG